MNKLLIVFLIIGLISVHVHGFVKRDAPAATNDNALNKLGKQFDEISESAKKLWEENAPEIQKKINEGLQSLSKQIEDLTKKNEEAKPKA